MVTDTNVNKEEELICLKSPTSILMSLTEGKFAIVGSTEIQSDLLLSFSRG